MTTIDLHLIAGRHQGWIGTAEERLTRALDRLLDWRDRARQRRQLLGLSDAALADFAASRTDAAAEGGKPFWRG